VDSAIQPSLVDVQRLLVWHSLNLLYYFASHADNWLLLAKLQLRLGCSSNMYYRWNWLSGWMQYQFSVRRSNMMHGHYPFYISDSPWLVCERRWWICVEHRIGGEQSLRISVAGVRLCSRRIMARVSVTEFIRSYCFRLARFARLRLQPHFSVLQHNFFSLAHLRRIKGAIFIRTIRIKWPQHSLRNIIVN
jgi:hypothetical protein